MKEEHENIRKIYASDNPEQRLHQADRAIPKLMGSVGAAAFVLGLIIIVISNSMNLFVIGLTGLGLLLLLAFVVVDFKAVKAFIMSRSTVYSTNFLIVTGALLGIMIIVNAISANHYIAIDLTTDKSNSLSAQTLKILNDVVSSKRVINMIVFMSKTDVQRIEVDPLLQNYVHFAPSLKYRFSDYEVQKKLASEKGVDRPCILLETEGTSKKVYDFDERSITAGILALVNPNQKTIGLITGHGEFNSQGEGGQSISKFISNLEKENYVVKQVDLSSENGIPMDISLVIIVGARKPFNEKEIKALEDFQGRGGAIASFLEPFVDDGLKSLYKSWGIEILPNMVIDTIENYFQDETVPVIKKYTYHPITSGFLDKQKAEGGFSGGLITPTATSLKLDNVLPKGVTVDSLAVTSDKSWGETSSDKMELNPESDVAGPLTIAAVGTRQFEGKEGNIEINPRFIVMGDADFVTDASIGEASNFDFAFNSINWLLEDESLIQMRTPINLDRRIDLEANQAKAMQLVNLFIPLLIAGFGIAKWLKRR